MRIYEFLFATLCTVWFVGGSIKRCGRAESKAYRFHLVPNSFLSINSRPHIFFPPRVLFLPLLLSLPSPEAIDKQHTLFLDRQIVYDSEGFLRGLSTAIDRLYLQ